mmetsp:Transcript_5338/g.7353  ORF Transcript_5338/g.7353 Transcript_5338/m.7353 type:complete len:163 (+) Transcript_5338:73-561(+)
MCDPHNEDDLLIEGKSPSKHYDLFVQDVLRPELERQRKVYAITSQELVQYQQLKSHIQILKERQLKSQPYCAMVHFGQGFHLKGVADDVSSIFVNIGLDYHVQLTLNEADKFIQKKQQHLSRKLEKLRTKIDKTSQDLQQAVTMVAHLSEIELLEENAMSAV